MLAMLYETIRNYSAHIDYCIIVYHSVELHPQAHGGMFQTPPPQKKKKRFGIVLGNGNWAVRGIHVL